MKKLLPILFILISFSGLAQLSMVCKFTDATGKGWNAVVITPKNFNAAKKYATIFTFPGLGEVGTDVTKATLYGAGAYAKTGGLDSFIVVALQPYYTYPRPWVTNPIVDSVISKVPAIDTGRMCATGYSHGGWMANTLACFKKTASDYSYMKRWKVVANVEGVLFEDPNYYATSAFPLRFGEYAAQGGKEILLEQSQDNRGMPTIFRAMDSAVKGSALYYKTTFGGGSHCCWDSFYGGNGTQPSLFGGEKIYDYILRNLKPTAPVVIIPPPPTPTVTVVGTINFCNQVYTLLSDGTWTLKTN